MFLVSFFFFENKFAEMILLGRKNVCVGLWFVFARQTFVCWSLRVLKPLPDFLWLRLDIGQFNLPPHYHHHPPPPIKSPHCSTLSLVPQSAAFTQPFSTLVNAAVPFCRSIQRHTNTNFIALPPTTTTTPALPGRTRWAPQLLHKGTPPVINCPRI